MNYKITDMRKVKRCPKCTRYKQGRVDKCICGYNWQDETKTKYKTKITKIYQSCPYCDAVGDQLDGLCEKHAEVRSLGDGIIYWLSLRNGENDLDVYRQIDNFVVVILNTLELDDVLQKNWGNYRQKNLEKIEKLIRKTETPHLEEPKQEETENDE